MTSRKQESTIVSVLKFDISMTVNTCLHKFFCFLLILLAMYITIFPDVFLTCGPYGIMDIGR